MKHKALRLTFLGCALLWTASAAPAQKETVLESGEEGEITLTQPAKVGDTTLPADTYVVQHRVSGGQHFIRFMQIRKLRELRITRAYTGWYTYTEQNKAGEIKCRVERLGATAQATTVTIATGNGTPRITRVVIKGEDDVHIF